MSVIAPLETLDKQNGDTPLVVSDIIAAFNLLANACTTVDTTTIVFIEEPTAKNLPVHYYGFLTTCVHV